MEKLDLENYDLRSDDLVSKSTRVHPKKDINRNLKVPRLNLKQVFEWREELNNQSDSAEEEEEEEEELQSENAKFLPEGSYLDSNNSMSRKGSLLRHKEEVIDLLNKAYENEESKQASGTSTSHGFNSSIKSEIKAELLSKPDDEVNIKSMRDALGSSGDQKLENKLVFDFKSLNG